MLHKGRVICGQEAVCGRLQKLLQISHLFTISLCILILQLLPLRGRVCFLNLPLEYGLGHVTCFHQWDTNIIQAQTLKDLHIGTCSHFYIWNSASTAISTILAWAVDLNDDSQIIFIIPGDIEPTAWGHPRASSFSRDSQTRSIAQLIHYFIWNSKNSIVWRH